MARRTPSQLNMLLAVDKPVGCTSHDVVSQCRRALHERRVGHAGTLDPLASGVMVVGVGQATRLLGMLTLDTKNYVADISFGSETNTDDAEGEAVRTVAVADELRDPAYARERLAAMLGPQMQVPPAFSAISVNGVRAYKSAQCGGPTSAPRRGLCRRPDRRRRRGRFVYVDRGVLGEQGHLYPCARSRLGPCL